MAEPRQRRLIPFLILGMLASSSLARGQSLLPLTEEQEPLPAADCVDCQFPEDSQPRPHRSLLDQFLGRGESSADDSNSTGAGSTNEGALSGNPGATDLSVGSGWLGDRLGINRKGFRFGGLNVTDANGQFTGGAAPGVWTGGSLTILDLSLDTEECLGWKGGKCGAEFLFFGSGTINDNAGTVMGYSSLDAGPPRSRAEIYTLWYRQYFLDQKFMVRIGKLVPMADFNNVVRSTRFSNESYNISGLSSAVLAPLYVAPTMLGVMPGYYNSATGLTCSFSPNKTLYAQYGLYDGNVAAGRQTGLEGPNFNSYNFHIVEGGANWTIGPENKPGKFGAGYWKQTGLLSAPGGDVRGAEGMYLFASHRLYYEQPGENNNGLSTYAQFGATNSDFISTHRFVGYGLTYFGPLAGRDDDSAGFAMAYGRMNNDPAAALGRQELIYTWYYQIQVNSNCFVQPNLTYISTPASSPGQNDVFALTLRAALLF
ncbi:MAG: carbohydrate porin [Gemmataceae bacterium]